MIEGYEIKDKSVKYANLKTNNNYELGLKVLYDMCNKYPLHNDKGDIISKLWLIGRSHSAALERNKSKEIDIYEKVADKMYNKRADIDNTIIKLKKSNNIQDNINEILRTHKFLMNIIREVTQDYKHSLTSKYLHFHCPQMFFIYDSRVVSNIKKLVRKINNYEPQFNCDYDSNYADFCLRALKLCEHIDINLTPRKLDNWLYNYKK